MASFRARIDQFPQKRHKADCGGSIVWSLAKLFVCVHKSDAQKAFGRTGFRRQKRLKTGSAHRDSLIKYLNSICLLKQKEKIICKSITIVIVANETGFCVPLHCRSKLIARC
jgi:hypothetical protein